jgi:photosystem II stability/assembly factor-like uncharacterized protein
MPDTHHGRLAAAVLMTVLCSLSVRAQREPEGLRPDEMSDVAAVALTPSIEYPHPNETVELAVEVRNRASRTERGVSVVWYAGMTRIGERKTDLPAGRSVTLRLPWRAQHGTFTFTAQVDPAMRLFEREREDNFATAVVVVTPQAPDRKDKRDVKNPQPAADLRVEGLSVATTQFENAAAEVGRWVSIGPRRMLAGVPAGAELGNVGRLSAIAIHPRQPSTLYVGGEHCGVWKTTDLGQAWAPVADALPSLAIAAIAIDPTTPSRVYVATEGAGIFRSEDDGVSWTALPNSPNAEVRWGVMLVHPADRNVLYVNSGSGVHRSRDFGATWQLVLPGGRVTDMVMDVMSPATLYAAREGNGLHRTTNGGDLWTPLTNGLPSAASTTLFHITLAICRNAPRNLYAGFTTLSGLQLFRSSDAGDTWTSQALPADNLFNDVIGVDPVDPHFAYVTGARIYRRLAGSLTFQQSIGPHVDQHAIASDPNTNATYTLNDGGIFRTTDRGATWTFIGEGLLNAEFFDHAVSVTNPKLIIGGTQDNGTERFDEPSTLWREIKDGDGGTVDIDPTNADIVYAMNQNETSVVRIVNGVQQCIGCGFPVQLSCFNPHFQVHPVTTRTVLLSCESLWRSVNPQCPVCPSDDGPGTPGVWSVILPVATTGANVLRSAVDRTTDLHYAGTSIGEVWAGPAGGNWRKIFTPLTPGMVTDLEIDPDEPSVIYVTLTGPDDQRVFRLRRSSADPTEATTAKQTLPGLPSGLTVLTLAVDRMTPFTIFVGTRRGGVFRARSANNGATWVWTAYNNGMPLGMDVSDLEVHPVTGVLTAATYGRGAFAVNTDNPLNSVLYAVGRITLLHVQDPGMGFGPPNDRLDADVVISLDSLPGRFFGFQLRNDAQRAARRGMFNLLRDAFRQGRPILIDYVRTGVRNGRILRVILRP